MVLPTFQHPTPILRRYRANTRTLRSHAGVTLIELLVVIAIISILTAVVTASLGGARQKGRDAQRISDIKAIQIALQHYYDANDQYPVAIGPAGSSPLVTKGFLPSLPTDPVTGGLYSYAAYVSSTTAATALCSSYHLGADIEGGSGHIALTSDADVYVGSSADDGERLLSRVLCSGSAADFHGTDGGKCSVSGVAGSACFDVLP